MPLFYLTDGSLMCFRCGGTLDGFLPEEDPWLLHAILYNHCSYLRLMRGISHNEDDDVNHFLEQCNISWRNATLESVLQRELENDNEFEVAAEGAVALPTEHVHVQKQSFVNEINDDSITMSKCLFESLVNGKNEDKNECKICSGENRNVVFLPCGHVVACSECAERCESCPICRARIEQRHKLYYS
ncbi:E3 ubiquitin-protein ligase XIAP-like [Hermetia illucens]|nr:E3 ubiquitin-protein ligase XIAP-like [Hermetia illucens]XP_037908414.1 E3 ubiquitin-protein ligase XIAP-like [Hermetia illucens]